MNEIMMDLFAEIEHGDAEHRQWLKDKLLKFAAIRRARVTRVEVITDEGRQLVNWHPKNKVELSYQDDDRTLKIFITRK